MIIDRLAFTTREKPSPAVIAQSRLFAHEVYWMSAAVVGANRENVLIIGALHGLNVGEVRKVWSLLDSLFVPRTFA